MQKTVKEAKDQMSIIYLTDGKWQVLFEYEKKWSQGHEIYEKMFKLKARTKRISTENRCN